MSDVLPVGTKLYACNINGRTMKHSVSECQIKGMMYDAYVNEDNSQMVRGRTVQLEQEDIGQFWFLTPEEAKAAAVQQAQRELDEVVAYIESLPLPQGEAAVRAEATRHGNTVAESV